MRQAGRQLREHLNVSGEAESSSSKRKNVWRRLSATTTSPLPALSLVVSEDQAGILNIVKLESMFSENIDAHSSRPFSIQAAVHNDSYPRCKIPDRKNISCS